VLVLYHFCITHPSKCFATPNLRHEELFVNITMLGHHHAVRMIEWSYLLKNLSLLISLTSNFWCSGMMSAFIVTLMFNEKGNKSTYTEGSQKYLTVKRPSLIIFIIVNFLTAVSRISDILPSFFFFFFGSSFYT
jgi:hypothetical protein